MKYISQENFNKLLDNVQRDYSVYVPVKKENQRFYKKYESSLDTMVIGEVRAFEPLKLFFTRAREKVAEGFKPDVPYPDKPAAVIGVKACDLKGFKIQDFVFQDHDYQDPIYKKAREENLIISADCTCAIETCFCLAVDIKPHPEKDYDINLSSVPDGFIAEAGSEKGKKLFEKQSSLFEDASKDMEKLKVSQRKKVIKEVEENIKKNNVPKQEKFKEIIKKNFESNIWDDEAKTCVECGACNTICPTCHCFLLYDQKDEKSMARLRVWDSCMIKDYARVAGGANPRPKLSMRLRNRFDKKFDFFPQVAGVYACTGCGRCISACPAKIDIRKVLQRLVESK